MRSLHRAMSFGLTGALAFEEGRAFSLVFAPNFADTTLNETTVGDELRRTATVGGLLQALSPLQRGR